MNVLLLLERRRKTIFSPEPTASDSYSVSYGVPGGPRNGSFLSHHSERITVCYFRSSPINAWDHASFRCGLTRMLVSAHSSSWSNRRQEARFRRTSRFRLECNPSAAGLPKKLRLILTSSTGGGEALSKVEATPPGFGRWNLPRYPPPFRGAGFLWFSAISKRRRVRRPRLQQST
jgi:hypothetical protein